MTAQRLQRQRPCCFMAASWPRPTAATCPAPACHPDPLLCGPAGRRDLLRWCRGPSPGCVVLPRPLQPPTLPPAPVRPPWDPLLLALLISILSLARTTDASSVLTIGLIGAGLWQRSPPPIRGRRAVGLGGRPSPRPPTRRLATSQGAISMVAFLAPGAIDFFFLFFLGGIVKPTDG